MSVGCYALIESQDMAATNFAHLQSHDAQLVRLGMLAERYFADDPNTCLLKLRQLTEALAQLTASHIGLYQSAEEKQVDLLRRLQDNGILPREVALLFNDVRRTGNAAVHQMQGEHREALLCLKLTWQLSLWFHRTFKEPQYKSGAFVPPSSPKDEGAELAKELELARQELAQYRKTHTDVAQQLDALRAQVAQSTDERAIWEALAAEAEAAKNELAERLTAVQAQAATPSNQTVTQYVQAANAAVLSIQISESDTRKLIDEQLNAVGWQADSVSQTYSKGARPQKGQNMAIAEWPTETGPADYVLFMGLTPVAVVEAKRKNIDVSASLQQAKRYSRGFTPSSESELAPTAWAQNGAFRIPFVFSTNGRPYLRQLETKSGVWFCDLRRADNLGKPLDGWYTPDGLAKLLKRDEDAAARSLKAAPFTYGFDLRYYQKEAIQAVERGIQRGKRDMLLAMATGTGKTKTCIALIYRLLKAQRFSRVLFLVDREALGEQAANAFKDTRMESLQTFADTFSIKELDEKTPDNDTSVQIATIQGMVQRLLYAADGAALPTVDQYDCIVVDECHRGYLLDRELSDTELLFRGHEDYVSKYRRVLDYFDAVKVGLTATPALHTSEIFGAPIYTYSYRDAVIDGFLVDYEPPIPIKTDLSTKGIEYKKGDDVKVYDPKQQLIKLAKAPDAIKLEVEDFNRKVITESFNRVVCSYLAQELDPASDQKTLIFCANDAHADLVVKLLKEAFAAQYGSVEDDAVIKITGTADKPLGLIRRYKNERQPNVAVTVDLLTTGIDVPEICNLVFLRRVNSRILFDQMLGRATRLCPKVDKEAFRVFDAVSIFAALQDMTAMRPVVVDPKISFTQLIEEITSLRDKDALGLVRDQLLAKLQRKRHNLTAKAVQDLTATAGVGPDALFNELRALSADQVAQWFVRKPGLGEVLDRKGESKAPPVIVSDHPDKLMSTTRGYGDAARPEDYLKAFTDYIRSHSNDIPALVTVLTRPRELTRKQLRELAVALDGAGFSEVNLSTAWREMTNQDIAARIVGYIRQAAIGDALMPYAERVDHALQSLLASRPWTGPQRDWLKRIAAQTKANLLVDREALDDPDLLFRRDGGGFARLDRVFGGELQQTLDAFNDAIWAQPPRPAAS